MIVMKMMGWHSLHEMIVIRVVKFYYVMLEKIVIVMIVKRFYDVGIDIVMSIVR